MSKNRIFLQKGVKMSRFLMFLLDIILSVRCKMIERKEQKEWEKRGKPTISYPGYHCGCCGVWVDEPFEVKDYESGGKWSDTIGLCDKCIHEGKWSNKGNSKEGN
jgi:hypothetical protein